MSNASLPFCHVCFHCTYRACSGKAFATEKHARSFAVEQPIRIVVELARSMQIMSHTSPVPQCFECGSGAHLHPPSEHATTETMQCCMVVSRGKCVLFCCAFLFSVLLCFDPADVRHHPREQSSIITSRTKNQELILHNYYYFKTPRRETRSASKLHVGPRVAATSPTAARLRSRPPCLQRLARGRPTGICACINQERAQ